jgi:predicted ATP-grasp superfamily ATP-dependent carboligase
MADAWSRLNHTSNAMHGYIVKPNDGAGCEDTVYCRDIATLQAWLDVYPDKQAAYIIQLYQAGTPASISILCKNGVAWLLSCNAQKIVINDTSSNQAAIQYQGSIVNGLSEYRAAFSALANNIAQALPGLNGYVGVDVIIDSDAIYVVEINPRITTSYIGLQESLNYNPAQLIMDLACKPAFELPKNLSANMIDISLHMAHS